jgi:protoporphyrinogen oxidase
MKQSSQRDVVIIGGGPAGLTAAYQLCKSGIKSVVLEKDRQVGGIARTVNYKGYRFDIGGHRFFTKVKAVDAMWREVLSEREFLRRGRLSRIYYNKKFFNYPLKPANALFGLGVWNSVLIGFSYLWAQLFPKRTETSFEDWVSNRFGKRLYRTFFKTYTEKVWGIPCSELSAEWAAQRIKGLSLLSAVRNAFSKQNGGAKGEVIKTLIDAFDYPAKGPGMMWERVTEIVESQGAEVKMGAEVAAIHWSPGKVEALAIDSGGQRSTLRAKHFISSMPVRELIQKLDPPAPQAVIDAASDLKYRDFLTVALILKRSDAFPDNWIYIHDPQVQVGRIQNFKNWSEQMVPDPSTTCLGLEYFCFEHDGLWDTPDRELVRLAAREIELLGLAKEADVIDGSVVRMPKAYPVYDGTYTVSLNAVRAFLASIPNIQLVGRNGMHKYNNQDHSMLTAMLAVENILGAKHDLWQVNADQEYHEEIGSGRKESDIELLTSTQPMVPLRRAS